MKLTPLISKFPAAAASLLISLLPALHAQALDPQAEFQAQSRPKLTTLPSGEKSLQWTGQTGHTYFLQSSTDLRSWAWLPTIQSGAAALMSNPVSGTTQKNFFCLLRSDKTAANPYTADFDGDGLSNLQEITVRPRPGGIAGYPSLDPNIQTSPVDQDTDHDGTPDDIEQDLNIDPTDDGTRDVKNAPRGDLDGDGISNSEEQLANTDPKNANDFPVQIITLSKVAGGLSRTTDGVKTGQIYWRARWLDESQQDTSGLDATPFNLISKINEIPFPPLPPGQILEGRGDGQIPLALYRGGGGHGSIYYWKTIFLGSDTPTLTGFIGSIETQRIWLKAPASDHDQKFDFFRQQTKSTHLETSGTRTFEYLSSKAITITVPAGQTYSAPLDFEALPAIIEQSRMNSIASDILQRPERAPDVLTVNSDFDEGRIDPATGYAIPDCDDIPGVDPETGAGNTKLELGAVRNHLDGTFTQGTLVDKDLHKGWFGITPTKFDDHQFYQGANVTLRKIDKIDADTGYKESGQVRFYAKWDEVHYGISPYNFQTLQPVNLVSAGVNLRPGEGIYGTTSTIPYTAQFYMEGVRPGKITLEWRYQKGTTDFKFEQTFQVETRKSVADWQKEVRYQIRLQTKVKTGIEVDVGLYDPGNGFRNANLVQNNVPRVVAIYDYYQQLFKQMPDKFMWAGMAKVAAAPIYAGMSDLNTWWQVTGVTPPWPPFQGLGDRDYGIEVFIKGLLLDGQKKIFIDKAWAHRAYKASGIKALDFSKISSPLATNYEAWKQLDLGILSDNKSLIFSANGDLLRREQKNVVQGNYDIVQNLRIRQPPAHPNINGGVMVAVDTNGLANAGEWLSANSNNNPLPGGPAFRTIVPRGRLDFFDDRWAWTSNPANGMLEIWTGVSTSVQGFDGGRRASENGKTIKVAAAYYSYDPSGLP